MPASPSSVKDTGRAIRDIQTRLAEAESSVAGVKIKLGVAQQRVKDAAKKLRDAGVPGSTVKEIVANAEAKIAELRGQAFEAEARAASILDKAEAVLNAVSDPGEPT